MPMPAGQHLILDLDGCDPQVLNDYCLLNNLLKKAMALAEATVLQIIGEHFKPQGVTLLALLAESHSSIHTWPELGYAAIDLYTCGNTTNTQKAADFLIDALGATSINQKNLIRKSIVENQ